MGRGASGRSGDRSLVGQIKELFSLIDSGPITLGGLNISKKDRCISARVPHVELIRLLNPETCLVWMALCEVSRSCHKEFFCK